MFLFFVFDLIWHCYTLEFIDNHFLHDEADIMGKISYNMLKESWIIVSSGSIFYHSKKSSALCGGTC
jgi:hypothetical protein